MLVVACWLLGAGCGSGDGQDVPSDTVDAVADAAGEVGTEDLAGAEDDAPSQEVVTPYLDLAGPEGVAVIAGTVYVTNTNGVWNNETMKMDYGTGYVSAFLSDTLDQVGEVETPFLNPQLVVDASGMAAVVCSGTSLADENWTMTPNAPGGVVVVDPGTLDIVKQVEIPVADPTPLSGFPGSAAWDADHLSLFLGSGTAPVLYKVDIEQGKLVSTLKLYDVAQGNDALVPAVAGGWLWAASFNQGKLYKIDPVGMTVQGDPTDITQTDDVEGPIDIAVAGSTLYVLLTLSSKVAAFDTGTGDVTWPFSTGASPNRIRHQDGKLYTVNSMDNNLTLHELSSGKTTTPFASFPTGTNPWELTLDGTSAYVTGYMSNSLFKVSLVDGTIADTVNSRQ